MLPKPKHLGTEYASQFKDQSIVEAYRYRPPYPIELFEILASLITDKPRTVLDIGCGTGDIARNLVERVGRVDAVDFSENMLRRGKQLPNGQHLNVRWINGPIEHVELHPPYALITAGESIHWMAWDIVMPRLQMMLTPNGYLAIVGRNAQPLPWYEEVSKIIPHFSTNKDFGPYDTVDELTKRHMFEILGRCETAPIPFVQSVDEYIESFHSRNGFSRERMHKQDAAAFNDAMQKILASYQEDGKLTLSVFATVVWGKLSASVLAA